MTFPILPMGTVMAVVMLITAAALLGFAPDRSHRGAARLARVLAGALAASGAVWQLAWYAARHPGSFWGLMAMLSGVCLLVAASLLLPRTVDGRRRLARWPAALALAGLAALYLVAIARL